MTPAELRQLAEEIEQDETTSITNQCLRELAAQLEAQEREIERFKAWQVSVSAAVQNVPEFVSCEWHGDKSGWGFHFEIVNWLQRHRASLEKALREKDEALAAADVMAEPLPCTPPNPSDFATDALYRAAIARVMREREEKARRMLAARDDYRYLRSRMALSPNPKESK